MSFHALFHCNQLHPCLKSRLLHRFYSVSCNQKLCHLNHRNILHVYGKDSSKLLQGLITNDVQKLNSQHMLYSMFLNVKGRCVFDVFIYNSTIYDQGYMIEHHSDQTEDLVRYLKTYKLRSKVKFVPDNSLNLYTIYNLDKNEPPDKFYSKLKSIEHNFRDSRLSNFGYRLLTEKSTKDIEQIFETEIDNNIENYNFYRHSFGISEGPRETENCLPLEHNLALLNGVSFEKGCYIGQESVARTNFVGVVRKRIMPLEFDKEQHELQKNDVIRNSAGNQVGKIINTSGNKGIGLMRLRECLKEKEAFHSYDKNSSKFHVGVIKPAWWPSDLNY